MKPQPQKSGCHRKIVQAAVSSRRSPRRLHLLDKDKDARRLQAADVLLRAASVVRTDSGKAPLLLEPWRQCCKYGPQTTTRTVPACIPISWHVRHPVRYLSVRLLRYVPRTSGIPTLLWYAQGSWTCFTWCLSSYATAIYHKTLHVLLYPNSERHHARSSRGR
jgi:hypothetical protein